MDLDAILTVVATARSGDSSAWVPDDLVAYAEKSGQWSLAKKDCDTSRLPDDSAPGDSLIAWVTGYASWGSPLDQVRVRYRSGKADKSWFVAPSQDERTGWDRTLDVLLPLLADEKARTVIAATIGRALRPILREAIQPVVRASVVDTLAELLQDDVDESKQSSDVPGCGASMASGRQPGEPGDQLVAGVEPD
jgi:hypothetical protein